MGNLSLKIKYAPIKMYTYETARSRENFIEMEGTEAYATIKEYVKKWFGEYKFDNKITIELVDGYFLTYWDGKITIGRDIFFCKDINGKANEYRTVYPIHSEYERIL
jgi:hypothetical protein